MLGNGVEGTKWPNYGGPSVLCLVRHVSGGEEPRLTLTAECAEEAGETLALTGDVVTGAVAVDTLRTRLAAALAEEAW